MRSEFGRERAVTGQDIDITTLGRTLARKKMWIIVPTLLACLGMMAFVNLVKPRYTSEAKVLIENGESFFTRPDRAELAQPPLPDDEAVQSQVQLITSRDIARAAIGRLGLSGNAEFDPLAGAFGMVSQLAIILGLEREPSSVSPEDRLLTAYFDRLSVFPVAKSRVITIEFTSHDPELSARAANTIADLYLTAQSATKRDAAHNAAESLSSLIEDLRNRVADAETKADAFRSQSGLQIGSNNSTVSAQQLSDMTTQLAQARAVQADTEAKAKLLRDMIKAGRVGDVPDVANNELIRRISEQRVNLRAAIAQQGRTLLPGHPHMQELNAQLQGIDAQLRDAAQTAVRTLENDARITASRVENLTTALDQQKKTASIAGVDQVQLSRLELQARLLKDQLEFNTAKYQQAVARENAGATPADARLISRAAAPQLPSFPKKLPMIGIATLAGLILSMGVLIALEMVSGRAFADEAQLPVLPEQLGMRPAFADEELSAGGRSRPGSGPMPTTRTVTSTLTEDETAEPTHPPVPLAGNLSPARGRGPEAANEAAHVTQTPAVVAAEDLLAAALRALRRPRRDGQATRVLVTSPEPTGDTIRAALSVSRLLASEARAIVVDFDAIAPLAPLLVLADVVAGDQSPPGLTELLTGEATFAEIIHRDAASRLHVVPLGEVAMPADALPNLKLVIEALAETYDYVVLHASLEAGAVIAVLTPEADVILLPTDAATPQARSDAARAGLAERSTSPLFQIPAGTLLAKIPLHDAA